MTYTYPAQFINEDNNTISVFFPDWESCYTGGWSTLEESFVMAKEVLEGCIELFLEEGKTLPLPSKLSDISIPNELAGEKVSGGCVMLVAADVESIEQLNKPIKKTISIPRWLDIEAKRANLNFSGIFQTALKNALDKELELKLSNTG